MGYSILVSCGYPTTWMVRCRLGERHIDIDQISDRYVDIGERVNLGPFWIKKKNILVLSTGAGFEDEGGVYAWGREYAPHSERIAGIGWCGTSLRNGLGKIVVPEHVELSALVKKNRPIEGDGRADPELRARIIEGIRQRNYGVTDGKAITVYSTSEPQIPGFVFGEMEAGILLRYGNNTGKPTAFVEIVSDCPDAPYIKDESHPNFEPFMKRIQRPEIMNPFKASLDSALDAILE